MWIVGLTKPISSPFCPSFLLLGPLQVFGQLVLDARIRQLDAEAVGGTDDQMAGHGRRQEDEHDAQQQPYAEVIVDEQEMNERAEQNKQNAERYAFRRGMRAVVDVGEPDKAERAERVHQRSDNDHDKHDRFNYFFCAQ
jgi:hypothetical protein